MLILVCQLVIRIKHGLLTSAVAANFERWLRGSRKCLPFAIARIWRAPANHYHDGYFYMIDVTKYKKGKDRKILLIRAYTFSVFSVLCYCFDVNGLFEEIGVSTAVTFVI